MDCLSSRYATNLGPPHSPSMATALPKRHDWSDHERACIDRLQAVCEATNHWELECNHMDAGDPWCTVYDNYYHTAVLHIARIDRQYVVVWPQEHRSAKLTTIDQAVALALSDMPPAMTVSGDRYRTTPRPPSERNRPE
jgi:hypothetical protein